MQPIKEGTASFLLVWPKLLCLDGMYKKHEDDDDDDRIDWLADWLAG